MKDLVILAADKDLKFALEGLLARPEALGIRAIEKDVFVEPEHDPACALRGVEFLRTFAKQYRHGLLIFDHEGSGREQQTREQLQDGLNRALDYIWGDGNARAIVIAPELEAWVWSPSPHVAAITGWGTRQPGLHRWLVHEGWLRKGEVKPARPKEAFQAALRQARQPRSASLYRQLAERVSLRDCEDDAFREFRDVLRTWFS
ncbi:MAG: hypothetical protein OXT71_22600 [Acidobacteriota bacterium]|nr:hypothetical protein [Acidobacteriota bacterium]